MFCPNCGFKLEDNHVFCPGCGKAVEFTDIAEIIPNSGKVEHVVARADEATIGVYDVPPAPSVDRVAPVESVPEVSVESDESTFNEAIDTTLEYTVVDVPKPIYSSSSPEDIYSDSSSKGASIQADHIQPQATFVVPIDTQSEQVMQEVPQYNYAASQVEYVAPATGVDVQTAPPVDEDGARAIKKSRKKSAFLVGFFGAIALAFLAGIVFIVSFITRPDVSIARAAKKTLLDSQSFSFEVFIDGEGKVLEGKVAFGENHLDSGFYFTTGDEYEEIGYYDGKVYNCNGSYDVEEGFKEINDRLGEMGFDITIEEVLDMLIDGEIEERAIFDIYEDQYDNIVELLEEREIDIELPEPKELSSNAFDLFKGIPQDAFEFEKDSGFGKKTIKYEVDVEKLLVGLVENLSKDEKYKKIFEDYEDETGYDVDDIIDEIKDGHYPDVEGKAVIEWGRLVEFSMKFDGEGFKIKFKDINETEVNQKTMDDIKLWEENHNEDNYYDEESYEYY